jgi:hypothetical protein
MKENKEQLIKDIIIVLIICIVATVFVVQIAKSGIQESKNIRLIERINTDSLTIDSLKIKITHDSLAHIDSLRVAHINRLKNKDDENKKHSNKDRNIILHATDQQLDSMWSIYSPKISN